MQLIFTGRNIDVTPALKNFTTEKFHRIEKRYNDIQQIKVIFHVENISQIAEANLHLDGVEINASAKADDMYVAIDELIDKLITQINKHKEKHSSH